MEFCVDAGSRSISYDESQLNTNVTEVNTPVKSNGLKKSRSCNLESLISKEDDLYSKSFTNGLSSEEVLSHDVNIDFNV